jgi:hypothetical protein
MNPLGVRLTVVVLAQVWVETLRNFVVFEARLPVHNGMAREGNGFGYQSVLHMGVWVVHESNRIDSFQLDTRAR